ncbi:MAG: carbon-nitrogen hydrolase family protein [Phycisphaerales bacterium]|jgi:predicted amidohydrolase|nr:carbon-nitrogen hydrolase family protein [Phycisphaerales bacterium]MDP7086692.1 carbon-nitrogen hydrolase family protein [Phycisphaerales bacterium]MDP7189744.1 carbon-nitrogen hydrolase family protein [Phycisphaerales bacterium]MDP7519114.1 carbon-nitrogen hydrolase family protein [Phycisphaerales bacterium]MDP7574111.1 carbon-nitrogen hydrolase family protein [Phycisphaerales bacterium]|tara:strand:+ start:270 stop:1127 length:858 start_codon:yes stop_codon:yes gene_type:complete
MTDSLTIALIRDVFYTEDGGERLRSRLQEAKDAGADLAVTPELAMLPWVPATKEARDEDAEPPEGPRHQLQSQIARDVGIGLLGGAIVRDAHGRRFNTALLFGSDGSLLHAYRKIHIPDEPGFWEADHYQADDTIPRPVEAFGLNLGFQICSDNNRPFGSHILGAQGADVILVPRSTEAATYVKWRPIFQANALTSGCWVLSVNRPGPEQGVLIGGPSIAVAPDGTVVLETEDPVGIVTVDRASVATARGDYPGYLAFPCDLYAAAWASIPPRTAHGPILPGARS